MVVVALAQLLLVVFMVAYEVLVITFVSQTLKLQVRGPGGEPETV